MNKAGDTAIVTDDAMKHDYIKKSDNQDANHKQTVIPDFEKLAITDNVFSDGATPPPLGAFSPELDIPATPRGRKPLTDEERAARKKERDTKRREALKSAKQTEYADAAPSVETRATADMLVGTLDLILGTISNGEFSPEAKVRAAYVNVWSKYLHATGKELPVWAEVTLMSAVYALPVMRSPTAIERAGLAWNRAKMWFKTF